MSADPAGLLRREVSTLMFDQYGTIVDMQGGLTEMVAPFLAGKGWCGDPHRFVTWWRRTHFEDSMIDSLCDRGHTSYREIGHRAVSQVMRRAGIEHTVDEVRRLVGCIERPEAVPRRDRGARKAARAVPASRFSRTATATCSRRRGRTSGSTSTR